MTVTIPIGCEHRVRQSGFPRGRPAGEMLAMMAEAIEADTPADRGHLRTEERPAFVINPILALVERLKIGRGAERTTAW